LKGKFFNVDGKLHFTVQKPATDLVPKEQKRVAAAVSYERSNVR
jgi:hypothetical protein